MKIRLLASETYHADGQRDRHTDGRTDRRDEGNRQFCECFSYDSRFFLCGINRLT
jgi:hypothetical protein